jgi:oxalate decarboxylase/phosphoglucose isomerase-like protein (cupin superfamily)
VDYEIISCEKGQCRMTVRKPSGHAIPEAQKRDEQ